MTNPHRTCGKLRHKMGCECDLSPTREQRLEGLVKEMLVRMKLINGGESKCVKPGHCENHELISRAEEILNPKRGGE